MAEALAVRGPTRRRQVFPSDPDHNVEDHGCRRCTGPETLLPPGVIFLLVDADYLPYQQARGGH
jgi:hypothetical protein